MGEVGVLVVYMQVNVGGVLVVYMQVNCGGGGSTGRVYAG